MKRPSIKMLKSAAALLLCSALLCGVAAARSRQKGAASQTRQFTKGDISEIKDKRRAFVSAAPHQTENIVKEFGKYPGVEVVREPSQADFVVEYRIEREAYGEIIIAGNPNLKNWVYFGRLRVYVPQQGGPDRLVWETSMRFQTPPPSNTSQMPPLLNMRRNWEQPLEKSGAGKFIKALKKARGEK